MTRTHGQRRPDAEPATHALTLRIPDPLALRLNIAALATDQAASDIIRAGLRRHLDELEQDPANRARYDQLRAALGAPTSQDQP